MRNLDRRGRKFRSAAFTFGPLVTAVLMLLGHDFGTALNLPELLPPLASWVLAGVALVGMTWLLRWLALHVWRNARGDAVPAQEVRLALLERLVAVADAPVFAKDSIGRYVLMNHAAGEMLGVDHERAIGRRVGEVLAPETAGRIDALDRRIVQGGETETFEEEFDRPQGRLVLRTTKGPLLDRAGRIVGVYGISRDITSLREREEEVMRLRTAVEHSTESVIITDLEGRIVHVNAAAEKISGYARAELVGSHTRILQSGKTPRESYAGLWAALGSGRPWHGVFFNRRKDGSEYTEEVVITPLRMRNGRITHFLAVKRDVTEERRMACELERHRAELEELVAVRTAELDAARQAAEHANESKSAFLATISHELRTPLNGVVGLAEVLARSNLNPFQVDLVHTMRESSFALLALIEELLDLSKIEAGRLDLESAPVALRDLVEGACDTLQPTAAARGVLLQVFVDPALPERLMLDALRCRQVLNNLVSNAIKFSGGLDRAGHVRVRIERAEGDVLRLSVADNGIGMSKETLARIFEPYTQADVSIARRYGGTGLGLPIVQRLVQAFGGTIEVSSAPDAGSTFIVGVPLVVAHADPAGAGDTSLRDLHCLVCVEDPQLGADWAAYLTAAGAGVECCIEPQALYAALATRDRGERVAVVGIGWASEQANELRAAAQATGAGLVLVGRGQRRSPRRCPGGEVVVDADAMHRAALVDAVALAAIKVPPGEIDIAAAGDAALESAAAAPAYALPNGTRVLVAEDNPVNQEVIRRQLEALGVQSDLVADGEAALVRWRGTAYALVLTDLCMPGVDGYEFTRRLRAQEAGRVRTPVIALTAAALHGEAQRCREAGMDDYIMKPVALTRLAALLRRWIPQAAQAEGGDPRRDSHEAGLPVFDPRVLAAAVGDDPALHDRIRKSFAASARRDAVALKAALVALRCDEAAALAHRLKGSAATIGALALADLCARLEAAVLANDAPTFTAAAKELDATLSAALSRAEPAAGAVQAALPSDAQVMAPTASVIVVDDDPFQIEVLRAQLAEFVRVPVLAVQSGSAALAAVAKADTAQMLMVVDLRMPEMDGVELLRRLAAGGYEGRIALMSAAGERLLASCVRLATELGLHSVGHLPKPASPAALRALVQRWQQPVPAAARVASRRRDVREIERALANREFVLHYQPKVSLADGSLVGAEALVRWRHPSEGLIYPDAFVGVAEENGLIAALTDEVLSLAFEQAGQWFGSGLTPQLAINVSMDDLDRLDFPERVLARLAANAMPPSALLLEVTESRLMRDPRPVLDILNRLRLHGVSLAIDDFGTGHSSLAQLRDLPFDELKIDRGFVHRCSEVGAHRAIVAASAAMARQLDMRSVAEGVEDHADWWAAREAGCDVAQGYHIAKPMPGELFADWAQGLHQRTGSAAYPFASSLAGARRREAA